MGGKAKEFIEDSADFLLQGSTGRLVGFEDGEFAEGEGTKAIKKAGKEVVKGAKEVTGAAAQERALQSQEERFAKEEDRIKQEILDEQEFTRRDRVKRSRAAGATRATSRESTPKKQALGASAKDFLGL